MVVIMDFNFLFIAEIIGTISYAMSGYLMAIYYRFDFLGIFISSILTALGGGIIRDSILSRPPFAFVNTYPFLVIIATILVILFLKIHKIKNIENNIYYVLSDSIGLISFSMTGTLLAINQGYTLLGVIVLSLVTAVGGGTIRDIMTNKVPFFLEKDFYAIISIIIAIITYSVSLWIELDSMIIALISAFALILRFVAYRYNWNIPKLNEV